MDNRFVSHKHSYSLRLSWRLVKHKRKRGPCVYMEGKGSCKDIATAEKQRAGEETERWGLG
jgi:hypothetical protein